MRWAAPAITNVLHQGLAWCFSRDVIPDLAPSTSIGTKSCRALASLLRDACKPRAEATPLLRPDTVLISLCSISWSAIIPMSLHNADPRTVLCIQEDMHCTFPGTRLVLLLCGNCYERNTSIMCHVSTSNLDTTNNSSGDVRLQLYLHQKGLDCIPAGMRTC